MEEEKKFLEGIVNEDGLYHGNDDAVHGNAHDIHHPLYGRIKENAQLPLAHQFRDISYCEVKINDHTLDGNLPPVSTLPQTARSFPPPMKNLGTLSRLRLELLHDILPDIDLHTLIQFRGLNRCALQLVDSLRLFKVILKHAQNAVRGILSINTGRWITCRTLHEKLCTSECDLCGDFSGYIYLLTCKRVCFLCLSKESAFLPLLPIHAIQKFGLDQRVIETLPRMTVVPGVYSPVKKKAKQRILVDYESALNAGIALHGSSSAMQQHVSEMEAQRLQAYYAKVAAMQQSGSNVRIRRPRTREPHDGQSENPHRFVAIVRLPWLNKTSQGVEWGFHCLACKTCARPPLHFRRTFTIVSFTNHLKQCGSIKNGKHNG